MNQSSDDQAECPLCMEPFEVDDLNFFPCTCGYQICRFCWHRIRTDENGLCPACRKAYPENPADFKPLSQEQVAKLKAEKRQKEQQKKQKATESRKHLANVRVVQKNLVFVVGLPIRLADPNVLKKHEYFGKFGKIQKVVINQSTSYAGAMGPSASAYVTYNKYEDALRAIQAINNIWVDNRQIKTSLGTTKYCSHFIKAQTCPKPDCMYLHDLGDPEASFTKEEMQRGKHQEYEKNLFEQFNNSMSQERKTTPSPPALGNSLLNSDSNSTFPSVNKEAWPSLQNGTTQPNTGGGTGSTLITSASEIVSSAVTTTATTTTSACASTAQVSALSSKQQQAQLQQPSKTKQKDKNNSNEKSANNKRKGKEKQMNGINNSHVSSNNSSSNNNNNSNSNNSTSINNNNYNNNNNNNNITVADKHDSLAKNNKEKEKRVSGDTNLVENDVNSRVQLSNNRSSLYSNENTIFSSNGFSKMSPTGSKDSLPLPNGFIKVPDNVTVNYETNSRDGSSHNCKEIQGVETRLLANTDSERVPAVENDTEKPLVNGYLAENINGSFDKINCNQKSNYSYQNGNVNSSNSSSCQQNIFNNYISLNKFGPHLKNENLVGENNESFMNQNSHILGQQNFLLKQQLAQQQRNQPSLQQMLIQQQQQQQQQQNVYQQPQNQYSQDFRLVQQQGQQSMNGFHSQSPHFNYMQQSNLRDQLLLQQKHNHLILNNYSPSGNNFIHLPKNDDLVIVDNLIPQHKFIENGLNHTHLYSSDYKLKENRKTDETVGEKGNSELHSRIGDDELGFDPFHETQKALADLMEKELLIQQNKQALQHKNDQYYHQSPQSYQAPHSFDNCGRGLNQFQVNVLNQQNHLMGGKLLAQIHSQQILNSSNQKSTGSNRLDGIRCTLPPPGFGSPAQNGLPGHLNNFGQGIPRNSTSRKILPFMGLSNGENSFQPHYVPNGVIKSDDWPESLRPHVQEGNTSSPSSGSPSFSSGPKVWSNVGNCSDWTALDPAIVSSSRPQHLSLHTQSLLNNQGLSQLHQNHLQNQMCQLNIGSVLSHNNWSTPRQNEDNWSTHIQTTANEDEKKSEESPYEKLMHSLHNDPKWLQEVNLGRRVGLYKFRCELGCGNFSQVKLAVHQLTKERVAVKIVDKGKLDDKMMRMLNQEISTMEAIHHPNLIRLYEVVETYGKLFLAMEYASGGELYNKVTTSGKLEELVARNLFAQICSAVKHMHERHIIHRDIKAENVFFSGPNRVKLGDFGFSARVTESNQRLNTFCGSPPYAAPELFCDENYLGEPVDVWALGVLLYFMVVGRMPFKGQNIPTLKTNIVAGVYEVPKRLSKECADLIENIIQQNPSQRLTVSSILTSDWLKGIPLPSAMDANQQYSLAPTTAKFSAAGTCEPQYSDVERTARERLAELGISSQLLESQHSHGSRSHIIGSYRIVVHRVQKQLCSFLEVDGFLPPTDSSPSKKPPPEKHKKLENKFQLSRILGKSSSSEDLFSNCWRRKASSDDETDAKEKMERLSLGEMETVKKAKMVLLNNRSAQSAKGGLGNPTTAVIQSTTCTIL